MTITVRGQKIRSQSQRRYIAVAVRPAQVEARGRTWEPFARIIKRSDNASTAETAAKRYGRACGEFAVVVDTRTGEEV